MERRKFFKFLAAPLVAATLPVPKYTWDITRIDVLPDSMIFENGSAIVFGGGAGGGKSLSMFFNMAELATKNPGMTAKIVGIDNDL